MARLPIIALVDVAAKTRLFFLGYVGWARPTRAGIYTSTARCDVTDVRTERVPMR